MAARLYIYRPVSVLSASAFAIDFCYWDILSPGAGIENIDLGFVRSLWQLPALLNQAVLQPSPIVMPNGDRIYDNVVPNDVLTCV
jgi:maltoporin